MTAPRTPRTLTLGLIQHACPPSATKGENIDTAVDLIREAASRGATLIATQELFASAYFCQVEDESRFDLAEPIPGPTSDRLCALAAELQIELTASLFERRAAGVYHNTSVMIGRDGAIVDRYRKMHIPDDPRFYEKFYFTPGDSGAAHETSLAGELRSPGVPRGFGVQHLPGAQTTTGMLVCWDQWYPEAARLTALAGAEILFYPTAIGWFHGETPGDKAQQKAAWQTIQKSHAIANGVFVAAINRIGTEDDLTFWGSSFVCDPGGTVIVEASADQPEALVVEVDLGKIETWRRGWPFLRDRRVDAYAGITRRLID